MTIPYSHGQDYYTPFYLLATLTNVVLLLWEGWRRGFPLRSWLTLVAASSLALILGTKLITHSAGEWGPLLLGNAPTDTARSILGGGLAVALAVLGLRRWLGLSWAVLDALALPLCGALMVQCVGCLLTGCCFGLPTGSAWGLTNSAGTLPWYAQVQAGLLPAGVGQGAARAYRELRRFQHNARLNEEPTQVSPLVLMHEREAIQRLWVATFDSAGRGARGTGTR